MTSALATPGSTPDTAGAKTPAAGVTAPSAGIPRPVHRHPRPALRLVPVPDAEPPFDDECTPALRLRALRSAPLRRATGQPKLTETGDDATDLTGPRRAGTPIAPLIQDAVPEMSQAGDVGVQHTATSGLPPAGRVSSVLARALIEALAGTRPVAHLRIHCTPTVYAGLEKQPRISGGRALRLQSAHVCHPADGVAEVAAVFRLGERARAMAFRLAGMDGRWRITALQVG
ncbi:Rv3235 family protein [Nakamurella aerolata]|uniref:Uncharacterized protein n=1 Tax=Nakamurella aerolata TaxID=1656892 RepID=A0A849AIP2_9ACTN|nr:Rv3235 family protein [Nakamurella aerolata]NNG36672.1 hypothetical protein [Nakamurella aerolata]